MIQKQVLVSLSLWSQSLKINMKIHKITEKYWVSSQGEVAKLSLETNFAGSQNDLTKLINKTKWTNKNLFPLEGKYKTQKLALIEYTDLKLCKWLLLENKVGIYLTYNT